MAFAIAWFDARDAKAFGELLAVFFIERVPHDDKIKEKKFALKTQKVLNNMQRQVLRFRAEHRLNVYKKAQIGNTFKWRLREAGFDSAYVEKITEWLMLQVS